MRSMRAGRDSIIAWVGFSLILALLNRASDSRSSRGQVCTLFERASSRPSRPRAIFRSCIWIASFRSNWPASRFSRFSTWICSAIRVLSRWISRAVVAAGGCAVGAVGWEVAGMLDGGCALDFFESALARASIQSRASGESSWRSISHWI